MPVTVKNRQTILDVAVEHLGDADAAIDIVINNGLDIDNVAAGTSLNLQPIDVYKQSTADLFNEINAPASAITAEEAAAYEDEWTLYYTVGLPANHG